MKYIFKGSESGSKSPRKEIILSKRGENIKKRKDGRWEGRYKTVENKKVKYRSVYGHTLREVREKLLDEKKKAAHPSNKPASPSDAITIQELSDLWFQDIEQYKKYSTYWKYKDIYEKYIKNELAGMSVTDINSDAVVRVLPKDLSQRLYPF